MNTNARRSFVALLICLCSATLASGQQPRLPDALSSWADWATWNDVHRNCPTPFNNAEEHYCYWPHTLTIRAGAESAEWQLGVTVMHETWLQLPGGHSQWPQDVRVNNEPAAVIDRDGRPQLKLTGKPQEVTVTGRFAWAEMPQWLEVPPEIGILSLTVNGQPIPVPSRDEANQVWLYRNRSTETTQQSLTTQVYRVVEDGIPLWLRTRVELTASGTGREEELGWILPEGWTLAAVRSPIPVAVDELGRMKAQVRAGTWTVELDAFRTRDIREVRYSTDAKPVAETELIAFRAMPNLRSAELQGIPIVDVTQRSFPGEWRDMPVYEWSTSAPFQLVQKMRGMGDEANAGLTIKRHLWLDENGKGLIFRDALQGNMLHRWRLDVAPGEELGRVRIDGVGQLITKNPETADAGVELRTRSLDLDAVGRIDRSRTLPATGWQADAESLEMTFSLPPGWRMLALLGADQVEGEWLTAWSLLDLFLLLVFAMAVFRLYGPVGGVVAFLAFGLSYHEWGAPRVTWFILLIPIALLRVVRDGKGRRALTIWKYLAAALLLLNLIPFVALQVQSALYPQLEVPGVQYLPRHMFRSVGRAYQIGADVADMAM